MNDYLYLIAIIAILLIGAIFGVVVLINRVTNKSNKSKAEEILDEIFKSMENDLANNIKEYIGKIEITNYDVHDPAQQFNLIESAILDFSFNKANKMITDLLNEKFPDGKSKIYEIILKSITHDKVEDIVKDLLSDNSIKDMITEIYNTCFGDRINEIEAEDKELEKELSQYEEKAEIIDETPEQHNQSIEEYAKTHIHEKVDELNKVYDEIEGTIPNTVPVRDLSGLKPLIDDEELNPPEDNPDESSFNEDVDEIVEYIDETEN